MIINTLFREKGNRYTKINPPLMTEDSVSGINLDFMLALAPAALWGIISFGLRAFVILLLSCGSAVLYEFLWNLAFKRNQTVKDLSAALTGLIIGLCLPASVPYWMPLCGSFAAIIVFKMIPDLFGKRFIIPAAGGYAFLSIWQNELNRSPAAFTRLSAAAFSFSAEAEGLTSVPLVSVNAASLGELKILDLISGTCAGAIGAVSPLLLLAGCIYLVWRRVISWKLPVYMYGSAAVLFALFPVTLNRMQSMTCELFTGTLALWLIASCSDFCGLPVTESGREIYAVGCGCLFVFFRYYGSCEEGVFLSCALMNLLSRPIDLLFMKPHVFGTGDQTKTDRQNRKNPYDPFESGPEK